jgi:hypothetical protein
MMGSYKSEVRSFYIFQVFDDGHTMKERVLWYLEDRNWTKLRPDDGGFRALTPLVWEAKASVMYLRHGYTLPSPFMKLSVNRRKGVCVGGKKLLQDWNAKKYNTKGMLWSFERDGNYHGRAYVERLFREMGLKCPWDMLD